VKQVLELIAYCVTRIMVALLGGLSQPVRVALFSAIFRVAFALIPRLRRTIDQNLRVAFPDKDHAWRKEIRRKNATEMGRLLADTVRLPSLTPEWGESHVEIPALEAYRQRLREHPSRGVIIATGHLGSFELLGHAIGLRGLPLAAVARKFQSRRFDRWWTGLREARGNKIIDRRGAFKEVVSCISSGMSAAILFDQNVTRNHAVFVDWLGVSAATTRSVALAALRTEAPIFVASILYRGNDRYYVDAAECEYVDVLRDEKMSSDEKVVVITRRLADMYCEMIRKFPEGWFWMHRRWKTRPNPEEARLYE
jgi:KDO2-lipid IV(A) lauroyltransferase